MQIYTYTDIGALVLNSYPGWPEDMPDARYVVPDTFAPVTRLFGRAWSVAKSWKNC